MYVSDKNVPLQLLLRLKRIPTDLSRGRPDLAGAARWKGKLGYNRQARTDRVYRKPKSKTKENIQNSLLIENKICISIINVTNSQCI